jgi:glycosyltransferase involved in cell wall biosynthesis
MVSYQSTISVVDYNSICLATYNGEKYIHKQLHSILSQINESDQVIIVDDCSTDNTVNVINSFSDSRIVLFQLKKNLGHVKAFEYAMSQSTGYYVFLSDQDDIWLKGRYHFMLQLMSEDVLLLNTSFNLVKEQGSDIIFKVYNVGNSSGYFNILNILIGKTYYYGCTFCIKGDFVRKILPIPSWVTAHDLYIGLLANLYGKVLHLKIPTVSRTIHINNLTNINSRAYFQIFYSRVLMLRVILIGLISKLIRCFKFEN